MAALKFLCPMLWAEEAVGATWHIVAVWDLEGVSFPVIVVPAPQECSHFYLCGRRSHGALVQSISKAMKLLILPDRQSDLLLSTPIGYKLLSNGTTCLALAAT